MRATVPAYYPGRGVLVLIDRLYPSLGGKETSLAVCFE